MSDTKVQKGKSNVVEEWRDRLGKGDDTWLDGIYQENFEKFKSWASRKYNLGSDELMDIYQQSVISLYENVFYRRLESLDSSPGTYLFGIAKNLILKLLRENKKMEKHELRLQEHWRFIHLDEDQLEETHQAVKRVLGETTEPCKSIIESYYLHGLSIQSIAKKFDYKSPEVVKTQKSRCMKTLKTAVKQLVK